MNENENEMVLDRYSELMNRHALLHAEFKRQIELAVAMSPELLPGGLYSFGVLLRKSGSLEMVVYELGVPTYSMVLDPGSTEIKMYVAQHLADH